MRALFDPAILARTYKDPVAWAILAIDLFPIYAVLTLGWGAAALVFLYWLENLVVGAVALARMIASSMKHSPWGASAMLFLGPFFTFHYGMFCFVHGIFVSAFAGPTSFQGDLFSPVGLVQNALSSAPDMTMFLAAIIALQAFLFVWDYLVRGQYKQGSVDAEMAAPYARIIVLHIGIFVGAGTMAAFGEPLWGVLMLIGLRAIWGVYLSVKRYLTWHPGLAETKS